LLYLNFQALIETLVVMLSLLFASVGGVWLSGGLVIGCVAVLVKYVFFR
jgi:Cu(I)/Ag(I) efflux system membrane protein CusA/SilA